MTFTALDYLDFRFLLFKIGVAGWVAVILASLLYYLVINPLIREFGIFRNDRKGKVGLFSFVWNKITRGKSGRWNGILLSEEEARCLQTAGHMSEDDKNTLVYLVFDYYLCGMLEDAQDITDLYEKKYNPGRVYAMKMLAMDATEMVRAGVSKEKIRIDVKNRLANIFHEE